MSEYLRERTFQHKVAIKENVPFAAAGLLCAEGAVAGYTDHVIYYGPEKENKLCVEYAILEDDIIDSSYADSLEINH